MDSSVWKRIAATFFARPLIVVILLSFTNNVSWARNPPSGLWSSADFSGAGSTCNSCHGTSVKVYASSEDTIASTADEYVLSFPGNGTKYSKFQKDSGTLSTLRTQASANVTIPLNQQEAIVKYCTGVAIPREARCGEVTVTRSAPPPSGTIRFTDTEFIANEGDAATVTVERIGGSFGAASVMLTLSDVSTSSGDYGAPSPTTVSWADASMGSKTVTIPITDDTDEELAEQFTVTLSDATTASLGSPSVGTVTIPANDAPVQPTSPGMLGFELSSYTVRENDGAVSITILREGGSNGVATATITVGAAGDSATGADIDYSSPDTVTLTWPADDDLPKSFPITILDDQIEEADEALSLSLVSTGASVGATASSVVTILDNDIVNDNAPTLSVQVANNTVDLNVGNTSVIPVTVGDEEPSTVRVESISKDTAVAQAELNSARELIVTARAAGSTTIEITATDNEGKQSDVLVLTVNVAAGNKAPVAIQDFFVITASNGNELLDILANDTDPDPGDTLGIVLDSTSSQRGVVLTIEDEKVRYQAPTEFSQTDTFSYKAKDDSDALSESVLVTVSPSDLDSDGIFDSEDNCPSAPNSDQNDQDSDDLGDACDPTPSGGNTSTDLSDEAVARATTLVNELCLGCHRNDSNLAAPQIGDTAEWDRRLADAGSIEALVVKVINGVQPGMPSFGGQRTPEQLTEAVLYLGGFATTATDTGSPDITEPGADNDADGYVHAIDDDDTNAKRLPGRAPVSGTAVYFISDSDMELGDIANFLALSTENQSGGILIDDQAFLQTAASLYPGVQPTLQDEYSKALGIIDLKLKPESGSGELVVQLIGTMPILAVLSTYDPQSGAWNDFMVDNGVGQLYSAQSIEGGCPVASSTNYIAGLGAGLRCIRLSVDDGGLNDADRQVDGRISLIAHLGGIVNDPITPITVTPGGGSSGGGLISLGFLSVLAVLALLVTVSRMYAYKFNLRRLSGIKVDYADV